MKKQDLIEKIIKTQAEKDNIFKYVAKREELEKLTLNELYFILDISERVESRC